MPEVVTVTGSVDASKLGVCLTHEHVLVDLHRVVSDSAYRSFDDEELAIQELLAFKDAGGRTLVEVTSLGIGRHPVGLRRVSEASGLNIVMGTGWYKSSVYPDYISRSPVSELADMMIRDITDGVGESGVRAGIIGEIGTGLSWIEPAEERVFRAAARAQMQTGVAISTHCQAGRLGKAQIELLLDEGVPADRVVIGHQGDRRNVDTELELLEYGVWVQFDHIGFDWLQRDEQRASNVKTIIDAGYGNRLLLSQDVCLPHQLRWLGGHGYAHLLKSFVPMLERIGLRRSVIDQILIANPEEMLAVRGRP